MRAAFIEALGPADRIRYGQLPRPRPGPGDVLVRVQAVAVDPVDTFVRSGAYPTPMRFPFVVGRDLVGTVAHCGTEVVGFSPGDPVWCNSLGHGGRQGAAAEWALVAGERLYHLPEDVDPVAAVAAVHPAATAHLALGVHAGLRPGETVYVGGGAGNVGSALVRLAALGGGRVIASAGAGDLGRCRALGAELVIDYRDPRAVSRVREAAPDGLDVHIDTSGQLDLVTAVELLSVRGRIILLAGLGARAELPADQLYRRDGRLIGFVISNATVSELAEAARRINQLLPSGAITPRAVEVLPLSAAAEAHRRLEAGEARGRRIVLTV